MSVLIEPWTFDRNEFLADLIRDRGYKEVLEVGVREGFLARHLLETTHVRLTGLDVIQLKSAMALMDQYPSRYQLIGGRSPDFACRFDDEFFDLIYVDADHSYEGVKKDLGAWWPKLAPGGCLCGDDFCDVVNPGEGPYGVVRAVCEFADSRGLKLGVVGCGETRAEQLAHAAEVGRLATAKLNGRPEGDFQIPLWFLFKHD